MNLWRRYQFLCCVTVDRNAWWNQAVWLYSIGLATSLSHFHHRIGNTCKSVYHQEKRQLCYGNCGFRLGTTHESSTSHHELSVRTAEQQLSSFLRLKNWFSKKTGSEGLGRTHFRLYSSLSPVALLDSLNGRGNRSDPHLPISIDFSAHVNFDLVERSEW